MEQSRKPTWWLLYLTVPLMIALLLIDAHMPYALNVHRIADLAIVLSGFALMALWVCANKDALVDEEIEKEVWVLEPDLAPEDSEGSEFQPQVPAALATSPYQVEERPGIGRYN